MPPSIPSKIDQRIIRIGNDCARSEIDETVKTTPSLILDTRIGLFLISITSIFRQRSVLMSVAVSRWISIVGGSALLVTGTIGALFNIAVFTHRTLRTCSCSWYILVAAFFDLLTLDHPLLLRVLADGFGLDLIAIDTNYCRLRFYTGQIGSFVPITLICLAASDRWAVSSDRSSN